MAWRWDFAFEILPQLLWGAVYTLMAAGIGYLLAVFIGLIFMMGQRTPSYVLNRITREVVEFFRSTPLLVQLFFVFYVAPQFGIKFSAWNAAMLTMGLHYGTYLSEVYRGAIEAVPKQQWEACKALNLSIFRTYGRIILPQALPVALPGMGNYLVGIIKDTPMLATIGVVELMQSANTVGSLTYRFLEPYTMVGVIFLIISLPTAFGLRKLESMVSRRQGISKQ
jgi:polar amino acid transport system permease protein|tara:strand:- start:2214 stop:2885 length:672 start_codon:yes stop_codon:yes gene_type:complete